MLINCSRAKADQDRRRLQLIHQITKRCPNEEFTNWFWIQVPQESGVELCFGEVCSMQIILTFTFWFHFLFPLSLSLFMDIEPSGSQRIWSQAMLQWSVLSANLKQRSDWCKLFWREGAVEVVELFCFSLINLYFFEFVFIFFEFFFVSISICIFF